MSDRFAVTVSDADLSALLSMQGRLDDFSVPMEAISERLLIGIAQAFANEADPATATPWQKLTDRTIAEREKKGRWPGKILQRSGRLAGSMVAAHGSDYAVAGTNTIYAGTMNFGAERGAFGRTAKHNLPIPFGDIPARPWAGISPDGLEDVLAIMAGYIFGA